MLTFLEVLVLPDFLSNFICFSENNHSKQCKTPEIDQGKGNQLPLTVKLG